MQKVILVLEDDLNILENITELLEAENYSVLTALNGKEGIEILKMNKPHLILCDIMMPFINGIQFFKYIKEDSNLKFIPFVFLTAKADMASIREGLNLGVDDYITKPFSSKDLLKVIEVRLTKQRLYNERVDSLVKNISMYIPHELRTPLVSIIGYSQLILSDPDKISKNEMVEMAEKILWAANRLHGRIEKFIHFSDINMLLENSLEKDIKHRTEFCSEFVTNIMTGHYFLISRAASLNLNIEPCSLSIAPQQLELLLKELLENAVKFSDVSSTIDVEGISAGDEYSILITDKGLGMTTDEIDKIGLFRQFNREIHSQDGNGLGLVIAKRIVEMNNGTISLLSEKNKHTTVSVTLNKYK